MPGTPTKKARFLALPLVVIANSVFLLYLLSETVQTCQSATKKQERPWFWGLSHLGEAGVAQARIERGKCRNHCSRKQYFHFAHLVHLPLRSLVSNRKQELCRLFAIPSIADNILILVLIKLDGRDEKVNRPLENVKSSDGEGPVLAPKED